MIKFAHSHYDLVIDNQNINHMELLADGNNRFIKKVAEYYKNKKSDCDDDNENQKRYVDKDK